MRGVDSISLVGGSISVLCGSKLGFCDPMMMLGQENQTKHLNVCLVQHGLEEGSEVV
jgi:hypothetical protein